MTSKEVLKLLKISRVTLCNYVKLNKIRVKEKVNGFYDYCKEDVYKLLDKDLERTNVLYCRVSTKKQEKDLENQKYILKQFCNKNGIIVNDIYQDIGSGINFDRKEFQRLVNDVVNHKIDKIFITYKDRLSRISFQMFKNLFHQFNCQVVVLNQLDDQKLIEKQIFNQIISLIHCFSMKVYSNRRKEKLKLIQKDLQLENAEN